MITAGRLGLYDRKNEVCQRQTAQNTCTNHLERAIANVAGDIPINQGITLLDGGVFHSEKGFAPAVRDDENYGHDDKQNTCSAIECQFHDSVPNVRTD